MTNLISKEKLSIVNIGINSFAEDLLSQNVSVIKVNWRPPLAVNPLTLPLIYKNQEKILAANALALQKIQQGTPHLISMGRATDLIKGMHKKLILHAGPPITWQKMCGPMRGGIIAALIYEGLAKLPAEAEALAASGEIRFAPCHEHGAVGPMAGIISASMPMFVIRNETFGNLAYCTLNEGLGKVLRYGAYGDEVISRLLWMEEVLFPVLQDAIKALGKIDLKAIIAQALHMGDELHNRNRAGTSLFFRLIAPAILETAASKKDGADALRFIASNDHFFLNLSMPASKAILDAARNVPNSSVVVVMARNGTEFGIQLSGTGNEWFTGPAEVPDALFFPGFTKDDANPDIGDSAITETAGLGGFAIAGAPAIVQFVGGTVADAHKYTSDMYEITVAENQVFQMPNLDFRGTPTGIDAQKVVETGIVPVIDTGVAHKNAGIGQVGAGVVRAPGLPFIKALDFLAEKL